MRFIIANRRSGVDEKSEGLSSRVAFDKEITRSIAGTFDVIGDTATTERPDDNRRIVIFEGSSDELMKKRNDIDVGAIIEPERPRVTLQYNLADYLTPARAEMEFGPASVLANPYMPIGSGASFEMKIRAKGAAVAGATLVLVLTSTSNGQSVRETAVSDKEGVVAVQYDNSMWKPTMAVVEPLHSFWPIVLSSPPSGLDVNLPELPRNGPLGWWHSLVGSPAYSETRGAGIRIGVIDTGFGPHPHLSHVRAAGSFIGGKIDRSPEAARDSMNHGTHVTGTICARPPAGSGHYGGIVPGAEVYVARVFAPGQVSNQGDIANAIDELSTRYEVDIINMSLGGIRSELEKDAISAAMDRGTLCICAAGNNFGGHVLFPAGYPECVAISALGIKGTMPAGSTSYANIPPPGDKNGPLGMFLAKFSNIGPEITCIAPGNAIISTVPVADDEPCPYLSMDGTSMASPVTTGVLAAMLSTDAKYKAMPRSRARAVYADAALRSKAYPLGLNAIYQGLGLTRI